MLVNAALHGAIMAASVSPFIKRPPCLGGMAGRGREGCRGILEDDFRANLHDSPWSRGRDLAEDLIGDLGVDGRPASGKLRDVGIGIELWVIECIESLKAQLEACFFSQPGVLEKGRCQSR